MSGLTVLAIGVVLAMAWWWRPPPARVRDELGHRPADRHGVRPRWRHRRGVQIAAIVAVTIVAGWMARPALVIVPATALSIPRWRRARAARSARHGVLSTLPDLTDLFAVALAAGLTPALAVERLATWAPPPFADALTEVHWRTHRGLRLADALAALPERLGDPVQPLTQALVASERYGLALGPTLELLAHDARRQRQRLAETEARRLPVRLAFPLVVCILPAFVLLTIVPLLAGALGALRA